MKRFEQFFERILWQSRLVVLVGVIASALVSLGAFYLATVDVVHLLRDIFSYGNLTLAIDQRAALRSEVVSGIVKAVDGYLIAAILLIFALGLYELFVNRIEAAQRSGDAPRLIQVQGLDDLKDRIAKLILLVLVIEFFQQALKLKYTSTLDLVYLALGILAIGGALYLSGPKTGKDGSV
jgi:uncharacterized membrane protein YqhA